MCKSNFILCHCGDGVRPLGSRRKPSWAAKYNCPSAIPTSCHYGDGVRPLGSRRKTPRDARFTCAELCVRNSIPCHLCDDVSPPWASCHPSDGVGHVMAVGELDFICSHSCHAQPLRCRTLVPKCSPVITESDLLGGPVTNGFPYFWPGRRNSLARVAFAPPMTCSSAFTCVFQHGMFATPAFCYACPPSVQQFGHISLWQLSTFQLSSSLDYRGWPMRYLFHAVRCMNNSLLQILDLQPACNYMHALSTFSCVCLRHCCLHSNFQKLSLAGTTYRAKMT